MHTIRNEYFLRITEIVEEYCRDSQDILQALYNAFWRGRFEAYVREGKSEEHPLMSRRTALKALLFDGHPGLYFASTHEEDIRDPDGDIIVDVRTRIVLPAEEADWKDKELKVAYGKLANVRVSDISDTAIAELMCQCVGVYELLAVLHEQGEPSPPFWLHWDSTLKSSRKTKSQSFQCLSASANWLVDKLQNADTRGPRRDLLAEAKDRGLSAAQFDKVWESYASDALKKEGRRPGSKNR